MTNPTQTKVDAIQSKELLQKHLASALDYINKRGLATGRSYTLSRCLSCVR